MHAPQIRLATATGTDRNSVQLAIGRAAERTGADFTYLLNQARSESGLDPSAKASTSSAGGLYQFIDQSWLGILKMHGSEHGYGWAANAISRSASGRWTVSADARDAVFALRNDAQASALMAGEFAQDNAAGLTRALGREPSSTDLYFAHFLGLSGATRFLRAADAMPDATAASLFPREARVNRGIFYKRSGEARTMAEVYALMGRKLDGPTQRNPFAGEVQMASVAPPLAASSAAQLGYTATALSADPPSEVRLVDVPASTATGNTSGVQLAMSGRPDPMSVLRPSPKTAMLAYMMVLAPFDTDNNEV